MVAEIVVTVVVVVILLFGRGKGRDVFKKCNNCGMTNHTVITYWDLYGKPSWANQANIQGHKINQNFVGEALTKEDYAKLQALWKGKSPAKSSATLAYSSKWPLFTKEYFSSWVIN